MIKLFAKYDDDMFITPCFKYDDDMFITPCFESCDILSVLCGKSVQFDIIIFL